jgi:hypothetical protein
MSWVKQVSVSVVRGSQCSDILSSHRFFDSLGCSNESDLLLTGTHHFLVTNWRCPRTKRRSCVRATIYAHHCDHGGEIRSARLQPSSFVWPITKSRSSGTEGTMDGRAPQRMIRNSMSHIFGDSKGFRQKGFGGEAYGRIEAKNAGGVIQISGCASI